MTSFGARLAQAMAAHGPLCVGIDPHPGLLQQWGLPDSAQGVREFSTTVLEAVKGRVAAVKPQVAFFERHGYRGMQVLEELVGQCRENQILCIMDAKRGDIGSTMDGYADAFLSEGGAFAADALTLSPFLGVGSLQGAVQRALENRRGVFLLALTSNPHGHYVQHAVNSENISVAKQVANFAQQANREEGNELGSVGLVVGATIGRSAQDLGIDLAAVNGPLLAPGIGAQGGKVEDLPKTFGKAVKNVLVNSSRDVLSAGPHREGIRNMVQEITTRLGLIEQ